jgi:hypothetical protein
MPTLSMANMFDDTQQLQEQVFIDDDQVVFDLPDSDDLYEIALSRCKDAQEILSWVHQLTEEPGISPLHLRRFIQLAGMRIGLSISA